MPSQTDLAQKIMDEIKTSGPMPIDTFMARALGDFEHGYYMKQDPFGVAGDFITAPEVSQVFGEMLGFGQQILRCVIILKHSHWLSWGRGAVR